ncbi:DcrB-related protein, partial [Serratia bockelmannii]|nr:DcrB-related protein [Serratia bockelmannii]
MKQHLKGWQQSTREDAALGDNLLEGEIVHASYLRDNKRVWQQQAVFTPSDGDVLVFTMTSNTTLTPADGTALQTLLRSFQPHA